jgi:hypothetical protein
LTLSREVERLLEAPGRGASRMARGPTLRPERTVDPLRVKVPARRVRDPGRVRAVSVHDVQLRVAIAVASEDDPLAVRRPRRIAVEGASRCQLYDVRAVGVHCEDVRADAAVGAIAGSAPVNLTQSTAQSMRRDRRAAPAVRRRAMKRRAGRQ